MTVEDLDQVKIRPSLGPDEEPVVGSVGRAREWLASRRVGRRTRFAVAFAAAATATLVLLYVAAVAAAGASSGRVAPGVRVGSVDVSGLSRDQVVAKLRNSYSYLGQGSVSVNTPLGAVPITYGEVGRAPDVEAMADAAMAVGHTGNQIGDSVSMLKSAIGGETIPVTVRVDPNAVATAVRELVHSKDLLPKDAGVALQNGSFTEYNSVIGSGLDEKAASAAIIATLTSPNAPSQTRIDTSFIELKPAVTDSDAQAVAAAAPKMAIGISLTWTLSTPPKVFLVDAQTVQSWIVFGTTPSGNYGPTTDLSAIQAYLSGLSGQVGTAPVEPVVKNNKAGAAIALSGGKDGTGIDLAATSKAIDTYLQGLAVGEAPKATLALVKGPVHPTTTLSSFVGKFILGQWTTMFNPDLTNGNGANIRIPAQILNGMVVAPGEHFSFLKAMGSIDEAHGFKMGGMIASGKSSHLGAIGGGICSASTTLFNAVMRAGLQIDERHAHFFYIDRYPVGLDATVFVSGTQTFDLKWTNDTPNPIVIRAYTTPGVRSTIVIQLWSEPLDRKVSLSAPYKANLIPASKSTQLTTKLAPGIWGWQELPRDGFQTERTRIVTDSKGKVLHKDVWISKYIKVDGLKLIGKAV